MRQYLDLMQEVLNIGEEKQNRTGIYTKSIFGRHLAFDLRDGFPLVTTKKVHFKSVVHELLWFIAGDTTTKYLRENGVTIWDEWAWNGQLGPIYGAQWRDWPKDNFSIDLGGARYIDQLSNAICQIRNNPNSRRIIVSAWNPCYLPNESLSPQENVKRGKMSLAPCHMMFQFNVCNEFLDIQMYQRSVDVFLGLPFNIASYALLLMMVAQITNKIPRRLNWVGGDIHLYSNHFEQAELQLTRQPKVLPTVSLNSTITSIDEFEYEHVFLFDYNPHPHIKGDIAV